MKREFESLTGSRKPLAAALAAAIIVGVQLIQQIVNFLLNLTVLLSRGGGFDAAEWLSPGFFWIVITAVLPFALGVFLCLWLLAPIAAELRLSSVVWRSLLAGVAGTVVLFVAVLLGSLFSNFDESAGLVFGWAYGAMATAASNFGWVIAQAMFSAGNMAVTAAPLTVLAGVLIWLWLRSHPIIAAKNEVSPEV